MGDDGLPPPPVSPPRLSRTASIAAELPGYVAPSTTEGEQFRQANLPRRIPDVQQPTRYRLARPGEKLPDGSDPPLYKVWSSSYKALDEFGIGVGLYYRQLLLLSLIVVACVVVYIPTIVHNAGFNDDTTPAILTGTAHNASREDLSLNYNGVPDLIVTLALVIFAFLSRTGEKLAVEAIDMAQQTPQDYSVCIHNPPRAPGLTDPDTYFDKFRKHGEIVFITICLKNGNLMKTVARKRLIQHKINALKAQQKSETTEDLKSWQATLQRKLGLFATQDYLNDALKEVNENLKGLAQRTYDPCRVYITFQTEQAQRRCLRAVETGLWEEQLACFRRGHVNQEAVVGGKVCRIDEAEEPTEILWENIDSTFFTRAGSWCVAGFFSALFMTGGFFILRAISNSGRGVLAAVFIALLNALLPLVIRTLTLAIEEHKSLTDRQASLMFKLVITRGINSAFLLFIITSDTEQLDSDTLQKILSILIADAFTAPLLRLTNVPDLIGRKLVGTKAKTQAEMNVFFQGALWNLAERYTDMIKTVFVGLFYSAIVPTGLIVTAAAMQTLYWVDKYSLLRQWRRPPAYNASLSQATRFYIILCIWLHLVMARIFFAKWPSQEEDELPDCSLIRCEDDGGFFTKEQEDIVNIYEVLGLVVLAVGGGTLFLWYARIYATKLVVKKHVAVGRASQVRFRQVKGIDAYIPSISRRQLTDPLLAIDVNDLPENAHRYLPLRIGGFYQPGELSMSSDKDFPFIPKRERDHLFAKVKYYPAEGEEIHEHTNQNGFLYEASIRDGRPPPPGAGSAEFGLARQASQLGAAFAMPTNPVEELSMPQRSHRGSRMEDPLPAGWEERTTGDGRHYYVSHATRTTQWERPTSAVATHGREFVPGISDVYNAFRELPFGWEARFLPDGRPYYVDHNSETTHWHHPAQMRHGSRLFNSGGASVEHTVGGTQLIEQRTAAGLKYYLNPRTNEVQWSPNRRRRSVGGARESGDSEFVDSSVNRTSTGGRQLPPGWERRTTDQGREYFVNHDRRITQWGPPDMGEQKSEISGRTAASGHGGRPPSTSNRPPGATSGQTGAWVREDGASGVPAEARSEQAGDIGRLPGYIEIRQAPDGRTYYVNHRTQVTSWSPPSREDW